MKFCCLHNQWYYGLLRLLTGHYREFRQHWLISPLTHVLPFDPVRPPLLHHLLSLHSAPPKPESSSRLQFQFLCLFYRLRILHRFSALSWSRGCPLGMITTLQDSLNVTDYSFILPSLQHSSSRKSTGRRLHGELALTMIELSSISKWHLARHTCNFSIARL